MQLNMKYIILYVQDYEKSLHFYRDILGLQVKLTAGTYTEFETGATSLSINTWQFIEEEIGLQVPGTISSAQTFEVGFVVDDVQKTIEDLCNKFV